MFSKLKNLLKRVPRIVLLLLTETFGMVVKSNKKIFGADLKTIKTEDNGNSKFRRVTNEEIMEVLQRISDEELSKDFKKRVYDGRAYPHPW